MKYDITNEEKEALKLYKGFNYEAINALLTSNCDEDIALLRESLENDEVQTISYKKDNVIKNIEIVKKIYELMIKMDLNRERPLDFKFVRGTSIEEVQKYKNEPYVDRMISVVTDSQKAKEKYASRYENPVLINLFGKSDIPKVLISDVLSLTEDTDEVIIAPFTQVIEIKDMSVLDENGEGDKVYNITIEKQKLEELSEPERKALYTFILQSTESIDGMLEECVNIELDIKESNENIRKLEQLLSKYAEQADRKESYKDYPETERREDLDDIERINTERKKINMI